MRAGDLSPVHVHEEELHVLVVDVLEDDDGVAAGVLEEELPEVGGADGEDQLVGGEVVLTTRYRHVDEKLPEKNRLITSIFGNKT